MLSNLAQTENAPLHAAFLALAAYSLSGTGICCDDFWVIVNRTRETPFDFLLANPVNIVTHWLHFQWIDFGHLFLYELLKFAWIALAYFMTYQFASLFFSGPRAALFAALFLLYPSHDATNFWFSSQYLTLTAAFYMYAFYLAVRDRLAGASTMAILGSFVSYGSSPWAFGLSLIFLLQKQFRRAAVLLVPNLIYIGYYVVLTQRLGLGNKRLPDHLDVANLFKQFVLQIAGGIDAVLGPSLLLKIWYSVASLTLISAVVGAAILALLVGTRSHGDRGRVSWPVWLGVIAVTLGGFGIFALSGGYVQTVFGMGNRITIYTSFVAAFWLVYMSRRPWFATALAGVLVFSTLGLSDHWKAWSGVQDRVIEELRSDAKLASGHINTDTLFVVGHSYSRLGPIAHIAFLSHSWICDPVFELALGENKTFKTVALASRFIAEPDALIDPKNGRRYLVSGKVVVIYDTEARQLQRIDLADMPRFIAGLEAPKRHWIQLVEIPWLRNLILRWMPQLSYLWR